MEKRSTAVHDSPLFLLSFRIFAFGKGSINYGSTWLQIRLQISYGWCSIYQSLVVAMKAIKCWSWQNSLHFVLIVWSDDCSRRLLFHHVHYLLFCFSRFSQSFDFFAPRHEPSTQCNHWFRGFSDHTRRNRIQGWCCLSLFSSRERKKLKLMRRGSKIFDFFGYAIFDNSRGKLWDFAGVRRRWLHAPLSNPDYRFVASRVRLDLHKRWNIFPPFL